MGGVSTGSMVKHLQQHDDAQNLKIAFISEQNKFIEPTNYFPIVHGHQNDQEAESYTIQAVIDKWSKLEIGNPVTSISAEGNSLTLENGKEFTYKSLVMAPGLNHSMEGIKGLAELADEDDQTNGVNVHMLSNKDRISRNYWGGWHHPAGDAIYDGYSYMPLYLGHSYCTAFSHLHDFQPAPRNHMVPHFGIFSRYYFGKQIGSSAKESEAYSDGKKNHGPPNFHYSANYDDLEHSEILAAKGVTPEEVRHPNALNRIENYVAPEIAAGH